MLDPLSLAVAGLLGQEQPQAAPAPQPQPQAPALPPSMPPGPPGGMQGVDLASLARARNGGVDPASQGRTTFKAAGQPDIDPKTGKRRIGSPHPKQPGLVWAGPGKGWVRKTDVGTAPY